MKQKFPSKEGDHPSKHRHLEKKLRAKKKDIDGNRKHKMKPMPRAKYRDDYIWVGGEE